MGRLLYSAAMSLDGFIAGPGGDMSWMIPYLGPNPMVDELTSQIGALLVGNRTFRGDDPYKGTPQEGEPFGGAWTGPQVVITHHVPQASAPGVTFAGDLDSGLDAGLLDEIFISIAPVLLGDGVRLFDHPGGTNVKLERLSLTQAPQATNLWLRVVR